MRVEVTTPQDWGKTIKDLHKPSPYRSMLKRLNVDTSKGSADLEKQLREGTENLKRILAERAAIDVDDPEN